MIHQAGPLVNNLQVCILCGKVLADYRTAPEGNWTGWVEGTQVLIVEDRPQDSCSVKWIANCQS